MDKFEFEFDTENDLEYHLKTCPVIRNKCQTRQDYQFYLYFALCNIEWQRQHEWAVLKNDWWSCSWRYAGGLVADIAGNGTYITYYTHRFDPHNPAYDPECDNPHPEVVADLANLGFTFREMD